MIIMLDTFNNNSTFKVTSISAIDHSSSACSSLDHRPHPSTNTPLGDCSQCQHLNVTGVGCPEQLTITNYCQVAL